MHLNSPDHQLTTDTAAQPRVLVLVDVYLPGFKAGGPIRTIANLVEALGDEFVFSIVTSDRDLGDAAPYEGIPANVWTRVGKAQVIYLSPGWRSALRLVGILRQTKPDLLYLNSLFSRLYSMIPMLLMSLRIWRRTPVLLAPRGELSKGALGIRTWRKQLYIVGTRWMYRDVLWHASTGYERQDILSACSRKKETPTPPVVLTAMACDLPPRAEHAAPGESSKASGQLSVTFLSRISPMKNLLGALDAVAGLNGRVDFSIYGPIEDLVYWQRCREAIDCLPPNIEVKYGGEIPHDKVHDSLAEHDVLLLPSFGENYGHVIAEALLAGCAVIVSDQTPWQNLEAEGAGWDLPLGDIRQFRSALQRCVDMSSQEFTALKRRAYDYGVRTVSNPVLIHDYRRLLSTAADLQKLRNGVSI